MSGSCLFWQAGEGAAAAAPAKGGWGALLRRRYRRIMILAAGLPIWQQASGINTVVFYSSDVSGQARLPGDPSKRSIVLPETLTQSVFTTLPSVLASPPGLHASMQPVPHHCADGLPQLMRCT